MFNIHCHACNLVISKTIRTVQVTSLCFQVRQLKEAVPFAVCGANTLLEVRGRKVRGRLYPWGVVEVENPDHCDFIKLRTMLM
jgi:Septin family protein